MVSTILYITMTLEALSIDYNVYVTRRRKLCGGNKLCRQTGEIEMKVHAQLVGLVYNVCIVNLGL